MTQLRGALTSLIYSRTMELQSGVYNESATLTLMSADVDSIIMLLTQLLEIPACTIQVGIGIWLLKVQIGWPCVAPIVVVIGNTLLSYVVRHCAKHCILVCFLANNEVAKRIGPRQKKRMSGLQARVSKTAAVLSQMKTVKMMGLTPILIKALQKDRSHELELSKQLRQLTFLRNALGMCLELIW